MELFAGLFVSDLGRAVAWVNALVGKEPAFFPNDIEAVWELAEHRYLYVQAAPERAGRGLCTLIVPDLDGFAEAAAGRGVEPVDRSTHENDIRKFTYADPDGNEIGVGG